MALVEKHEPVSTTRLVSLCQYLVRPEIAFHIGHREKCKGRADSEVNYESAIRRGASEFIRKALITLESRGKIHKGLTLLNSRGVKKRYTWRTVKLRVVLRVNVLAQGGIPLQEEKTK